MSGKAVRYEWSEVKQLIWKYHSVTIRKGSNLCLTKMN
jgi:hypothetical protein